MLAFPARLLATLCTLAALTLLVYTALEGDIRTALGQVWYALSPDTLNLTQAVLERYVLVALWDPILLYLLQQPAFLPPALFALLFAVLGRSAANLLLAAGLIALFWVSG